MKHKYRILCIFSTFGRDFKLTAPTLIGEDVIVTFICLIIILSNFTNFAKD